MKETPLTENQNILRLKIKDLVEKKKKALRESDDALKIASRCESDIKGIYSAYEEELGKPYIGHTYKQKDGSFFIVKWDEKQRSLMSTTYLPDVVTASRVFVITDFFLSLSEITDERNIEIDMSEFIKLRDEFLKKYVLT